MRLNDRMVSQKFSGNSTHYIVVHLLNNFSGSPRVLSDFCATEQVQSQSLTIITSQSEGFLDHSLGEKRAIWYPRGRSNFLNSVSFAFAQLQLFFNTSLLVLKNRWRGKHVVVVNNTILTLGSMIASRICGASTLVYIHEINSGPPLMRRVAISIIDWAAHQIIFVSKFASNQYEFNGKAAKVLPNGLRIDFDLEPNLDLKLKFNQRQVLFVGSLKQYKGVYELLKLVERMPDTPFTGVFNCSASELQEFSASVRIPKNLTLLSNQPNIQKLYQDAFLVMNLSLPDLWIETFALTVLEGMACGCPCVVPLVGGHLDYFDHKSGLKVDARNTKEIVDFIEKLQGDYDLWRGYSDHVLTVAKKYSAAVYSRRVDEFLIDCNSRHKNDEGKENR